MSLKTIGENISALRKEKGVTQEELGRVIGVSTQAVSKWECGGVPDTELLPQIADYFGVSVDRLFGRSVCDYQDIESSVTQYLASFDKEKRIDKVYELCWAMEQAIGGTQMYMPLKEAQTDQKHVFYSHVLFDSGITLMCLNKKSPFFMVLPESDNRTAFLLETDYTELFLLLSDREYFNALVNLYKREGKAFTRDLFIKNLKMPEDKTDMFIEQLKKYNLLFSTQLELDDETKLVFNFNANPMLLGLLTFAKSVVNRPTSYHQFYQDRRAPFLK